MYRLSPRRNHRSKSFKVKHILQICLLLAVCFWLIYQVKRSQEKRKEFDSKDEILVGKVQTDGEIQRFGRKDLPRVTEIATNGEKHSEDEEEKEVEKEGNRLDEDEPETENSRIKDKEEEDAGREDGDDEIDENELEKIDHEDELEKSETEAKHKKEQVNEDTGRGKNEAATQDNHVEDDDAEEEHSESEDNKDTVNTNHAETEDDGKEDNDHDGRSTNTQEAREVQYKADDASSEVAHNIQTTIPETKNSTTGNANEIWGKVNVGQENKTKSIDQEDAGVHPQEDKTTNNGELSNITIEINSTKSVDSSLQNSTLPALPSNKSENSSNSSAVGAEHSAPLTSNGTQTTSDEKPISLGNVPEDEKQLSSAVSSNKTESVNTDAFEFKISSNMRSASSQETSNSDTMLVDDEKSENGSEEGGNIIQHDPIDESDVTLTQEIQLPEIRNEVQNSVNTTKE